MINNKKITALIPIKAHSERVKNKNFRDFAGKPLYHHILDSLQNINEIDEIIINTDSERVIEEAPKLFSKVKIHKRTEELLGDYMSVNKLIEYDINNSDSDIYIQTHATNPLLKSETIYRALNEFISENISCDSIFSVNKFQTRFYTKSGKAINHDPKKLIPTQHLEPYFEENSLFFIFTKESFKNANGKRIGTNPKMFETSKIESFDIDEESDFFIANAIAKEMKI